MPFYEYQCGACGQRHEALQKINDEPLLECPACGAAALARVMSAPAFRLKGGGWYETDFKSGNKRHLADSGEPKPDKPAADKAEAKPAPAPKPAAETPAKPAKPAGGDA